MPRHRGVLTFAVGLAVGAALLVLLVVPELPVSLLAGREVSMSTGIPVPVIAGGVVMVGTIAWLAATWVFVWGAGGIWARVGGHVTRLVRLVLPESPLWRFAVGVMLLLILVLVIIGLLPALVST